MFEEPDPILLCRVDDKIFFIVDDFGDDDVMGEIIHPLALPFHDSSNEEPQQPSNVEQPYITTPQPYITRPDDDNGVTVVSSEDEQK